MGPHSLNAWPDRPDRRQNGDSYRARNFACPAIQVPVLSMAWVNRSGRSGENRMVAAARRGGSASMTLRAMNCARGAFSSSPTVTRTPVVRRSMPQTGWFSLTAFSGTRSFSFSISARIPPKSRQERGSVTYPLTVSTSPFTR